MEGTISRLGGVPSQNQIDFCILRGIFVEDAILRIGGVEGNTSRGEVANQSVLVRVVDILFVVDDGEEDRKSLEGAQFLSGAFLLRFKIDQAHLEAVAWQGRHAFDARDGTLDGIQLRRFGLSGLIGIVVASGELPRRTANRTMGASGQE